jgi:PEP-CTERM motif
MNVATQLKTAIGAIALVCASTPAIAAIPLYPNSGTENPATYTITATANTNVIAYFAGNTGSFTNLLGLLVNGTDTGILGLNSQTSTPGDLLDFGAVNAGDLLTFYINVTNTGDLWYSDKVLNTDGVNHAWSTAYGGGDFGLPAGQFMTFEDLSGGGDFNYQDLGFVFTNVDVMGAVPEPASWALMLAGFGLTGVAVRRRAKVTVTYA